MAHSDHVVNSISTGKSGSFSLTSPETVTVVVKSSPPPPAGSSVGVAGVGDSRTSSSSTMCARRPQRFEVYSSDPALRHLPFSSLQAATLAMVRANENLASEKKGERQDQRTNELASRKKREELAAKQQAKLQVAGQVVIGHTVDLLSAAVADSESAPALVVAGAALGSGSSSELSLVCSVRSALAVAPLTDCAAAVMPTSAPVV